MPIAVDKNGTRIQVGDKVLRTRDDYEGCVKGNVYVVSHIDSQFNSIELQGCNKSQYYSKYFEVVKQDMPDKVRDPHPHAEVIKAWLDGYPVQYLNPTTDKWCDYFLEFKDNNLPSFFLSRQYRIKPIEPEPTEKEKQVKELVRQAEELLAKAKELEASN